MLELPNITLVAVATKQVEANYKALKYSSRNIDFGRILFMSSDEDPSDPNVEHVKIKPFKNIGEWGEFIVFELYKFITVKPFFLQISENDFLYLIPPPTAG